MKLISDLRAPARREQLNQTGSDWTGAPLLIFERGASASLIFLEGRRDFDP